MNGPIRLEYLLLFLFILVACKRDIEVQTDFNLSIRLHDEPDFLHPVLSRNAIATQLEKLIFSTPQAPDIETLELQPILLREKMTASSTADGSEVYAMHFRDDIRWNNGTSLTALDYIFSVKAALNPMISNQAWANFVQIIDTFLVDPDDAYRVDVVLAEQSMQAEAILSDIAVFPEYVYDPEQLLRSISLSEIKNTTSEDSSATAEILRQVASTYGDVNVAREQPTGCGPYQLIEWVTNERLIFERKQNWWGDDLDNHHPFLANRPQQIVYYIIPDQQSAIANLKSGALDLMFGLQPEQFTQLQNDSASLKLVSAPILQFYYIAYNNGDPILSDVNVRRALSYSLDIDQVLDKVFFNITERVHGPIHPSKTFYRRDIEPIPFDLERAQSLLSEAGWYDTNGDGTLDKIIDGQSTELSLDIFTLSGGNSRNIALIFKEYAKSIGVSINIISQSFAQTLGKIRERDFQMAALASRTPPGLYDPYNLWHSDNSGINGTNYCGFVNESCDDIIVKLRSSQNAAERDELYSEFQEIIHQEQPALFLVSPKITIAAQTYLDFTTTAISPGFVESDFKKVE